MNGAHLSGSASSGKIASTGHSGSHAPQSMHSSGSITSNRPASWMQSTGQTSTQDLSLMSMHGSAMMYVTRRTLASGPRPEPENRRAYAEGTSSATSSPARSTSADFTTTWSKPAACAARSPAVSVGFGDPGIRTAGYGSAASP